MLRSTLGADLGREPKLDSSLAKSYLVDQGATVEANPTHLTILTAISPHFKILITFNFH